MRLLTKFALWLTAFVIISGGVNLATDWYSQYMSTLNFADAARIYNVRLLDMQDNRINTIRPGGVFRIAFNIDRKVSCEAIIQNSLVVITDEGVTQQMFNFESAPFRYVTAGNYETQEILHIPDWLPPRRYLFNRQVRYLCEGKKPAYFTFATVALEVTSHEHME